MDELRPFGLVTSAFIIAYSTVSKYMRDALLIPDSVPMLLFGMLAGPKCLNLFHIPYFSGKAVVSTFARLLLCIQTMAVALSLPAGYLRHDMWPVFMLVIVSGLIKCCGIFLLLRICSTLTAPTCWAIASSLTPTDPILCSSITRGKFARNFIPERLRALLSAESGINDGFGIVVLNISLDVLSRFKKSELFGASALYSVEDAMSNLYVTSYTGILASVLSVSGIPQDVYLYPKATVAMLADTPPYHKSPAFYRAIIPFTSFIVNTIGVKVVLSSFIGYSVGFVVRKITRAFCAAEVIRSEILLVQAFVLTAFGLTTMDVLRGSEFICIFFIGTSLNADSLYHLEGSNRRMSDLVENLFANAFFALLGSLIDNSFLSWRFVIVALVITVVMRPVSVISIKPSISALVTWAQAFFVGWFGPIGVGALYYSILYDKRMNTYTFDYVMYIVAMNTILHGLSVPLLHFGSKLVGGGEEMFAYPPTEASEEA